MTMTQKEKLKEAFMLAMRVKGVAKHIRMDAAISKERGILAYAEELERAADNFLKITK